MITREELSLFAEFCQTKYQIDVNFDIIDDFMQSLDAEEIYTPDINSSMMDYQPMKSCSSNNIDCTHVTFHSAKCDECPN